MNEDCYGMEIIEANSLMQEVAVGELQPGDVFAMTDVHGDLFVWLHLGLIGNAYADVIELKSGERISVPETTKVMPVNATLTWEYAR